jgi:hypothetical protein
MVKYISNLLVGLDQFGNTLIGGSPDETISARAGRLRIKHPYTWGALAWALDKVQTKHVQDAIINAGDRAEGIVKVEDKAEKKGL